MLSTLAPVQSKKEDELTRLRDEYARRRRQPRDDGAYTLFNLGHLYLTQQRQRAVMKALRAAGIISFESLRLLEVGCGSGDILREWLWGGATPELMHGVELLPWRLQQARERLPHLPLINADGQRLPYQDRAFDLVAQYTAFSSILDDGIKQKLAAEMLRVVKPDGLILWYDFWLNPTNPQTRGIRPAQIRALFPHCRYSFQRITLAPPLARRLIPFSWQLCALLEKLWLLNTHYLVTIRPR